jgi:peptidoglycan-associated lipoprotein
MHKALLLFATVLSAAPAAAQLRFGPLIPRRPTTAAPAQAAPGQSPLDVLRADFAAQAGGTTVYFAAGSAQLTPQARTILAAQAMWLRQHPTVPVRIEGHGDPTDTRDHALALGAERAGEARDYLVLLGLPAAQVSTMTWGKERPGPPSAVTTIAP